MVLMIVRWEAGTIVGGQRRSNERNSRQPRDLTKNRQSDCLLIRVCILFLVRWRREMLKSMVLLSENQSDSHRSMWQRFRVLKNYGTGPSLSRPTMPAKMRRGGSSHHTPVMWWGEGLGRSWQKKSWFILHAKCYHFFLLEAVRFCVLEEGEGMKGYNAL
jgi:hypothetical protein